MSFRIIGTILSCFCILTIHLVASDPPNILIITADNLGYGDLPCYNSDSKIVAPHLDQLASESALLTSFYTASSTCTVSRACLLTGRIAQRHGLEYQLPGVDGNYGVGLNHSEILIPSVLKSSPAQYATACFGKWNIGFAEGSRPTERGFDEFIGNASGNCDYFYHNYREMHDLYNGTEELYREGDYTTDIYADAAIDFMKRKSRSKEAWFCYVPFNAPHFPTAGNKRPGQPNIWQAPDWAFDSYEFGPEEDDPFALMTIAAYIDLNPVRAGIVSDPVEYRYCGYGEAMGGSKIARRGIARLMGSRGCWGRAMERYRVIVFGKGYVRDAAKVNAGVDAEKTREILNTGGRVSRNEALRCRVRYFSDGAVLGSKEFVQGYFESHRDRFGAKRRDGPRKMRGSNWEGLMCIRDLRRDVFG